MKKWFLVVGQLLVVASIIISHYELPVYNFIQGMMVGAGVTAILYGLIHLKPKQTAA